MFNHLSLGESYLFSDIVENLSTKSKFAYFWSKNRLRQCCPVLPVLCVCKSTKSLFFLYFLALLYFFSVIFSLTVNQHTRTSNFFTLLCFILLTFGETALMREWHDQHLAWAINLHFTLLRFAPTTLSIKLETHSSIYSFSYSIFDHQQHCRSKSGRLSQWVPSRTQKYSQKFQLSFCMCFSLLWLWRSLHCVILCTYFCSKERKKEEKKLGELFLWLKFLFAAIAQKTFLKLFDFFPSFAQYFFLFSPSSLIFLQLLLAANSGSSSAIQTRTQQH